jgi:hypothetical protein
VNPSSSVFFFLVNHTLGRRSRIPEHMMMKTSEDDDV